jgi:DNA modification methylase
MNKNNVLQGDCREVLKTLADESVDCCVTSPPYYGLRDYGTGKWIGGDPNCPHKGKPFAIRAHINENCTGGNDIKNQQVYEPFKKVCPLCGAIREDKQIGLEETAEEYIKNLVEVFREVRRVLKDDGTLWVNIGDSYAGNCSRTSTGRAGMGKEREGIYARKDAKPKDLIGIPWMLAFALRADGWYLRQDIIWAKPNPMPESVKDRCTKSHEYIFLLSKSQKYYFDYEAIQEDAIWKDDKRKDDGRIAYEGKRTDNNTSMGQQSFVKISDKRNKRDVWFVSPKPVKEAHFATYPEELIEPCILAGSRAGGGCTRSVLR